MEERYEQVKTLGRGAFGVAILVRPKAATDGGGPPEFYVMKQVDLQRMESDAREEALREVGVLRQLSHANIVAYIDFSADSRNLNLVMEYADGGDLSAEILARKADSRSYSEPEALGVISQVLQGLRYVHGRRIIHRDLKCQNVFLTKTGPLKIGDFGISRILEHTAAVAGTVVGTPAYLAPEVCDSRPYDTKVDIWATGIIMYELLALKLPFQSSNLAALVMKIVASAVAIPETWGAEVRELVEDMLQKEPATRPSASDLLAKPLFKPTLRDGDEAPVGGMSNFEVVKVLGRGAFGQAVLARQHLAASGAALCVASMGALRVVKKVDLTYLPPEGRRGALKEVAVLRRLSHPHIVAYFDNFVENDVLHIVLEYADGGDLAQAVSTRRQDKAPFEERTAMMLLGQCMLALKYIHTKLIIHRDLKARNVFLMKTGDVKLGDFGIARVMEHTASVAGTFVGTPAYLAPEICEGMSYDSKIDIWASGVLAYELVSLKQPFTSPNIAALALQIVSSEVPELPLTVTEEVRELVGWMLKKKPDLRPSAAEVLASPLVAEQLPDIPGTPCVKNHGTGDSFMGGQASSVLASDAVTTGSRVAGKNFLEETDDSWDGPPIAAKDAFFVGSGASAADSIDSRPRSGRRSVARSASVDSIDGKPKASKVAESVGSNGARPRRAPSPDMEEGWSWAPDVFQDSGASAGEMTMLMRNLAGGKEAPAEEAPTPEPDALEGLVRSAAQAEGMTISSTSQDKTLLIASLDGSSRLDAEGAEQGDALDAITQQASTRRVEEVAEDPKVAKARRDAEMFAEEQRLFREEHSADFAAVRDGSRAPTAKAGAAPKRRPSGVGATAAAAGAAAIGSRPGSRPVSRQAPEGADGSPSAAALGSADRRPAEQRLRQERGSDGVHSCLDWSPTAASGGVPTFNPSGSGEMGSRGSTGLAPMGSPVFARGGVGRATAGAGRGIAGEARPRSRAASPGPVASKVDCGRRRGDSVPPGSADGAAARCRSPQGARVSGRNWR